MKVSLNKPQKDRKQKQKMWRGNRQEIMEEKKKDKYLLDTGFSSSKVM
jgi:hypothetical protein